MNKEQIQSLKRQLAELKNGSQDATERAGKIIGILSYLEGALAGINEVIE